jgi:hypothetical protein
MRFSLAISVVVVGLSVSGLAQQNNTFKYKNPPPQKAAKQSAPINAPIKNTGPSSPAAANAKNLRSIEHQSGNTGPHAAKNTMPKTPALKPVKEKPNPPINFGGTNGGGGKSSGTNHQGSNELQGRLKQKGSGHQ